MYESTTNLRDAQNFQFYCNFRDSTTPEFIYCTVMV